VEKAAGLAGGQDDDGVRFARGAKIRALEGVDGDIDLRILPALVANRGAFSPIKSIGASSRSPSPITIVPSMPTRSISSRMASTAAWSDL
jgi:hypothetical protein